MQGALMANPLKASNQLEWQPNTSVKQLVNEMVDADMAVATNANGPRALTNGPYSLNKSDARCLN